MRVFACTVVATWLLGSAAAFAVDPSRTNHVTLTEIEARKALLNTPGTPNPVIVDVGGDTIGSAVTIASTPYSDSGNTCQFAHNYDEVCPFNAPGAPDVVYRYVPSNNLAITIDLCTSLYDTKVYVYDGGAGCGTNGWRSYLASVPLDAGHTYYIVVDGYSPADCGTYFINVTECSCPTIECPPEGLAEGEPDCHDNYVDVYNGGCNSSPPVFSTLPCDDFADIVVCGTYGGFLYNGLSYRDTDWYEVVLGVPTMVTWCGGGEDDTLIGIIEAPCPATEFHAYAFGGFNELVCVSELLPAGTWYLWIGTLYYGNGAASCGAEYVATLSGYFCGDVAVEPTTWGTIKNRYR